MPATKIGYARCSTDGKDLTAQKQWLEALGVNQDRIHTDRGLIGRAAYRKLQGAKDASAGA